MLLSYNKFGNSALQLYQSGVQFVFLEMRVPIIAESMLAGKYKVYNLLRFVDD
jgi:hypothetical protein